MFDYLTSQAFLRLVVRGAATAAIAFLVVIANGIAGVGLPDLDAGIIGSLIGTTLNLIHSRVPDAPKPFERLPELRSHTDPIEYYDGPGE